MQGFTKLLVLVAAVASIFFLSATKARAADFKIGQVYEGSLQLNGKIRAPLLEGRWEVIGVSENYGTTGSSYSSTVNNIVLAQVVDRQVRGAIYVSYNERSLGNGWHGQDKECHRQDIHHTVVRVDKQTVKLCGFVNHIVFSISSNSAKWWTDSVNTLVKKEAPFPGSWVRAGIWASNRSDFVFVTYDFNPEFLGIPQDKERWEMSSWNKVRISSSPDRKAFVDAISLWLDNHLDSVNQGVNENWPADKSLDWPAPFVSAPAATMAAEASAPSPKPVPPSPATAQTALPAAGAELETKLGELKSLYDKKLITEDEYAAKRKILLDRL